MADNYIDKQYERYLAKNQELERKKLKAKAKALDNYRKKLEAAKVVARQSEKSKRNDKE